MLWCTFVCLHFMTCNSCIDIVGYCLYAVSINWQVHSIFLSISACSNIASVRYCMVTLLAGQMRQSTLTPGLECNSLRMSCDLTCSEDCYHSFSPCVATHPKATLFFWHTCHQCNASCLRHLDRSHRTLLLATAYTDICANRKKEQRDKSYCTGTWCVCKHANQKGDCVQEMIII